MISRQSTSRVLLLAGLVASTASTAILAAQATDWTQWGGPTRDFRSDVTGLAMSWPKTGPPLLWSRDLGEGYSGLAVQGNRIYTMYRKNDQEVVVAMEAATGRTIWEYAYDAPFVVPGREADSVEFNLEQGPGPHGMPLIVGDRLFTLGTTGYIHALNKNTGKVLWNHQLFAEFKGSIKKRGYTANPTAYKDMVIVPVGADGASLVAFNQADGAIVWKQHDYQLAYSTPTFIDVDGQIQLVAFMRDALVGVNPDNGDLYWSVPAKSSNGTHVSMPVWGKEDHLLFFSAAYGLGGHMLRLTRNGNTTTAQELWTNQKTRVHFTNAIRIGQVIYASTGDFGPAFFSAFDVKTGTMLWQERGIARASFLLVDGRFLLLDEDGKLALATPSEKGLTIHAEFQLMKRNAWTIPTLVGKTLYVRDRKTILALDLS